MDLDIYRLGPVAETWPEDLAFPIGDQDHVPDITDVLFNPDGLIFSPNVCEALTGVLTDTVEWLPLNVLGHGAHYLLHPLRSVDLGPNSFVHQNSVSKNITVVRKYDFAQPGLLPACFMRNQAVDSAAAQAGFCMRGIYVNTQIRRILERFRGVDFGLVFDSEA